MTITQLLTNLLHKKRKKKHVALDVSRLNVSFPLTAAIHSGEGEPGKNHLDTWVPLFQKSGVNFCIITRVAKLFQYCKKAFPSVPVVFASKDADLEKAYQCIGPLKVIFYPSNTGYNVHSVRFNRFKHVFLGHGDSEKTASVHKVFRMYDEVWVAGQAHIDRFHNAGFDVGHMVFVKIGRPMLKKITDMLTTGPWQERLPQAHFCYLPTWEGVLEEQSYSSLPQATYFLSALAESYPEINITIKLHPLSGARFKSYKKYEKNIHDLRKKHKKTIKIEPKTSPLLPLIPRGNLFICDISAALTDCLLPDVPVFVFINPQAPRSTSSIPLETFTYTFESTNELLFKVQKVLQGNDYLAAARNEAREYFLGLKEMDVDTFEELLRN